MDATIDQLLDRLPDREAARRLYLRLESEQPDRLAELRRKPAHLANLLTLAAYSPWLGDSLNLETIDWLGRQKDLSRGFTKEDFLEELARFALRHGEVDEQSRLAQFKLRELARINLRDTQRVATLTETTEEISHLADAILERALTHVRQQLVNRHGVPQTTDDRGRRLETEFAVVALGKLGSRELNYASDIDLMFLYSGPGQTTAEEGREPVDNHTFFRRLAEALVKTVGSPGKTAPVYRIDLRLRPYGRDGDLAIRCDRAVDYYAGSAQNWERQMLIRARCSAGSDPLVAHFLEAVRDVVFRPEPMPSAIAAVVKAKEKIDRDERLRSGGYNVKLGPGGIREIEFITQALQLVYGGRDAWIRAPRVLIGLQRLSDKGLLSDADRATLSDAYVFLRTVEHRLQMAHGVQTHRLPTGPEALAVVARRCGYDPQAGDPAEQLRRELERYTTAVRAIYERVLSPDRPPGPDAEPDRGSPGGRLVAEVADAARPLEGAARLLSTLWLQPGDDAAERLPEYRSLLADVASRLPHPARALRNLGRYLASLATCDETAERVFAGGAERLDQIIRLLGSGSYFGDLLVTKPALASEIPGTLFCRTVRGRAEFGEHLGEAVRAAPGLTTRMAALRRAWYREILEVGCHDVIGRLPLAQVAREQTELAEATLDVACWIALEELVPEVPVGWHDGARFSIQAFGRLAHAGMDYGSDLDLLIVYDPDARVPSTLEPPQFYARFVEVLVRVLSSLTREGYLYRVDLRLRPEGRSGRPATTPSRLEEYLLTRASPWELTVYLKVRPTSGVGGLGQEVRERILGAVFDGQLRHPAFRGDLRRMRLDLERRLGRSGVNIKWGAGGLMDVYFVTRYLQLVNRSDFPPDRGTVALVGHLLDLGSLAVGSAETLASGYTRLRLLDHCLRLHGEHFAGRLPEEPEIREELAEAAGYGGVTELEAQTADTMASIRGVFEEVLRAES